MATTVWSCVSGLSVEFAASGLLTATPCCSIGAMSIMMMSSTNMTSTSGVTLISDLTPPFAPPTSIAMGKPLDCGIAESGNCGVSIPQFRNQQIFNCLRRLLDEVVDQLRRGVIHFDVEVLDAAGEVVVEPHGRDRDDEA